MTTIETIQQEAEDAFGILSQKGKIRLRSFLRIAYESARSQALKEAEEAIAALPEKYPVDIFAEPWKDWHKDLEVLAVTKGYHIDNISSWYARWQEGLMRQDAIAAIRALSDTPKL